MGSIGFHYAVEALKVHTLVALSNRVTAHCGLTRGVLILYSGVKCQLGNNAVKRRTYAGAPPPT